MRKEADAFMQVMQIENVNKIYGGKLGGAQYVALRGITATVESGEFLGIMGPSGSGKTTLLNVASTIDKPTSGTVLIEGKDVTKLKDPGLSSFRRSRLGFIFQDFNLLDTMTLHENIVLPLVLANTPHGLIKKAEQEIVSQLGIDDILGKYPYEVSGGQKQRAAAARALITKPALLLADEPTGALDSKSSRELLQSLESINTYQQATIMMVTHDPFAASYCRRILFIKDGMIFNEIFRGNTPRKDFYQKILQMLAIMGGEGHAV